MSAARVLETLTISQETVLETLKEAADLLCSCHTNDIAPLAINPGEFVELYTLTIDCGEGDIIWLVECGPTVVSKRSSAARESLYLIVSLSEVQTRSTSL